MVTCARLDWLTRQTPTAVVVGQHRDGVHLATPQVEEGADSVCVGARVVVAAAVSHRQHRVAERAAGLVPGHHGDAVLAVHVGCDQSGDAGGWRWNKEVGEIGRASCRERV